MELATKTRQGRRGRHAAATRLAGSPIWPILTAIIGVILLLYPVFATQYNDVKHRELARDYKVAVEKTDPHLLEDQLARADKYNANLKGGIVLDPYLEIVRNSSPEYRDYLSQLNLFPAMASVVIPKVNIDLPIFHGTDENSLKNGVGHLFGSSLPVGGTSTHAVLTGHTGLGDATLFNNIKDLVVGDAIYINIQGRNLKYEVQQINVVLPTDSSLLGVKPGEDLLTLITCTPYGINSHRLLVTAHRVPLDPVDKKVVTAPQPVKVVWEWWMYALIAFALTSLVVVLYFILRWIGASKSRGADSGRHRAKARG